MPQSQGIEDMFRMMRNERLLPPLAKRIEQEEHAGFVRHYMYQRHVVDSQTGTPLFNLDVHRRDPIRMRTIAALERAMELERLRKCGLHQDSAGSR